MELQNNDSNLKDINDAKNVAKKLGIDHFVVDLHEEFKERVVDPFVKDYLNGVTPNPCVKCNKWIKFGRMLKVADEMIEEGYRATIEKMPEILELFNKKPLSRRAKQKFKHDVVII